MGQQLSTYFGATLGRFMGFLPSLISGLVILVLGYAISRLVAGLVSRGLSKTHFDHFAAERLHYRPTAPSRSASSTTGRVVFWFGILVTLSLTASAWHLYGLSVGLNQVLGFFPHILVAAVIIGVAAALANLAGNVIGDLGQGWLAKLARVSIMVFAAFMALSELGIAKSIVTTTFSVLLSAAAVSGAIAFGVGNIRLAGEYTRKWVARGEQNLRGPPRRPSEPPEISAH